MSSTASIEKLQQQIEDERAAHVGTMADLAEKSRALNALLAEQQESFKDLITRVTELRVAKGEYMAAQTVSGTQHVTFNTGHDFLDSLLYKIQAIVQDPLTNFWGSLLKKLENASLEALTPYGPGRVSALFTSNATAVRTTGLLLLLPGSVRGVEQWARKHLKSCASCAAQQSQLPPWRLHYSQKKETGFAAAPKLRAIPHKHYHHVCVSFLQGRSMADRMDTEDRLVVMNATAFVHVQAGQTGQPLADAVTACAQITQALQTSLEEAMEALRDTIRSSAPWNTGSSPNGDLSAAIEIFLHMVQLHVQVLPTSRTSMTVTGAPCTVVKVEAKVDVPLHISTLAPFLKLLDDSDQVGYVIHHVFMPLAQLLGDALGHGPSVAHYTAICLHFVEALYRIAVCYGFVEGGGSHEGGCGVSHAPSASPPRSANSRSDVPQQLYLILQSLAVFGTTIDVEVITPDLSVGAALSTEDRTRRALRFARALLLPFSAPKSPSCLPEDTPGAANMAVRVVRAPTTFLEILNRAFSSNHRLPSTARSSALDMFVSPKLKINMGLKLYKELVIDVYRPFHSSTGIFLAAENGTGGRPRAPPCTPVIDLPEDVVTANKRVAELVAELLQKLDLLESSPVSLGKGQLEKEGKAYLQGVASALQWAGPIERLRGQWAAAKIKVVEVPKLCVDVLLPFDAGEADVRSATRPLLYLRVTYND